MPEALASLADLADPTASPVLGGWARSMRGAEKVQERLRRVTAALEAGGVPYAVIGGNAVAEWVGRIDEEAVRITKDVDILLRRADWEAASAAVAPAGFRPWESQGVPMFLDGPDGTPRSAVHVIFANEIVREGDALPAPDVADSEPAREGFQVLALEALVRMLLVANRDEGKVHIEDLLEVGQIDATWTARLPPPLGERLAAILATPDG